MPIIEQLKYENLSTEAKAAIDEHVAEGHRITNEKLTLLHNVPCFTALEVHSYNVDRELAKMVGQRAADIYEYAISQQNDCVVCSTYFAKLMKTYGIDDMNNFEFTKQEELLVEFAKAITKDVKNIPEELYGKMKEEFSDEEIVVITTMGVFMIANNYFNDILKVEPEK